MDHDPKAAGLQYTARWRTVMNVNGGEIQKVKLTRMDKRQNLPASSVGPFIG
jgi:hypothetical protein